jgi:hypothetical protein
MTWSRGKVSSIPQLAASANSILSASNDILILWAGKQLYWHHGNNIDECNASLCPLMTQKRSRKDIQGKRGHAVQQVIRSVQLLPKYVNRSQFSPEQHRVIRSDCCQDRALLEFLNEHPTTNLC